MSNYCQDSIPEYAENTCQIYQLGGISDLAVIDYDPQNPAFEGIDWEDLTDWNTLIAAGLVRLVKGINANVGDPSDVTTANPVGCGVDNIKIKSTTEITYTDANVSAENTNFYSALDGRATWLAIFWCQEGTFRLINTYVTWSVGMPNAADQNSFQTYKVKGTYTLKVGDIPVSYDTPVGLL